MSWRNGWRCVSCKTEVSWHVKMNSHGRCPVCGHKGEQSSTIMDTEDFAYEVNDELVRMKGVVLRHRNRIGVLCGIVGVVLCLLRDAPWYVVLAGSALCLVAVALVDDL